MDDVLQYVLEQIAFSGSFGLTISQLWDIVQQHFVSHNIDQNIDQPYKELIWRLLYRCKDVLVGNRVIDAKGVTQVQLIAEQQAYGSLSLAVEQRGEDLVLSTTEERQWLTLTGHAIDYKAIPTLAFACLSAVSAAKANGITMMDLYKETGQDKRSAPARCKRLAAQGLIHGFPILSDGNNTTLYVHYRFLAENALQREKQAGFGGKSRLLDLHFVRKGISDLLVASTNRILKTRDCCTLMRMTSAETDKWTQRRFYTQLRVLHYAGFVKLVRVPGKLTGTLIACVELLKEYTDADINTLKEERDVQSGSQDDPAAPDDLEADQEEELNSRIEPVEELDLSNVALKDDVRTYVSSSITKDHVLELTLQEAIYSAGFTGLSGPELRNQVVGEHWTRPFDENIKRLCPAPSMATQPCRYGYLAIGPAVEENMGRVRQYRYRASGLTPGSIDDGDTVRIDDKVMTDKLPKGTISPGRRDADSEFTTQTLHQHQNAARAGSLSSSDAKNPIENENESAVKISTAVGYDEAKYTRKRVSLGTRTAQSRKKPRNDSGNKPSVILHKASTSEAGASVTSTSVKPDGVANTREHELVSIIPDKRDTPALSTIMDDQEPESPKRASRSRPAKRDLLRKITMNSTAVKRRTLLTQIIEQSGGIALLDPEFIIEFDRLLFEETKYRQITDRSTLKKTLDDMVLRKQLQSTVRMFPSRTSNFTLRRDIYFLNSIDSEGHTMNVFVELLKDRESVKKPVSVPHRVLEIAPRPEMDIIPTVSQTNVTKLTIDTAGLTPQERSGLRVRLGEKQYTNAPSTRDQWFAGSVRVWTLMEIRQQRRDRIQAEKQATSEAKASRQHHSKLLKPKLPKIARVRLVPNTTANEDTAADVEQMRHHEDDEIRSEDETTTIHSQLTNVSSKLRVNKKYISKRADKFADHERALIANLPSLDSSIRRSRHHFDDGEDDSVIRAANISMIFFSKSSQQLKIDWDVTQRVLPHRSLDDCRRRYATLRNRAKYKTIQSFLQSTTFTQLYNEAVLMGTVRPLPRNSIAPDGTVCDIRQIVEYSRQFDPERRFSLSAPLPDNIEDFRSTFTITKTADHLASHWTDEFLIASSNTEKRTLLTRRAFCLLEEEEISTDSELRNDYQRAMMKSLLLTQETDYTLDSAKTYVSSFASEDETEVLLRQMMKESVVVGEKMDERRLLPGRNFQLSERFFQQFRGVITTKTLEAADSFDKLCQESFTAANTVLFPPLANNGAAAATIELAVRGYLNLEQGQKHWGKHGLIHNYSVRQIDGYLLDFDIIMVKGKRNWPEVRGNKVIEASDGIPYFWIDINGKIMPIVYKKALILIIGIILSRGQVTEQEILRQSLPVFEKHELRMCLRNLEFGNLIEQSRGLYGVTDQYYSIVRVLDN